MIERPFDFDPVTGLKTTFVFDPQTEEVALRYEQDVDPILDSNKRAANDATGPIGEMAHVAKIPVVVQLKWMVEKGVDVLNPDHKQAVAKLLDDPEWRYLKVRNIILGKVH